MKKSATVLAAIAVTFSVLAARATEYTYSELFENGKIWNVVDEYYDYINDETTTECLQVSVGDESKDGPQFGCAGQLATELRHRAIHGDTSHDGSLARLVQSALFEVEQHLEFHYFHTLIFLSANLLAI